MMSSMTRMSYFVPILLATAASAAMLPSGKPAAVEAVASQAAAYVPAPSADIDRAIADWKRLRQSDGYSFADYARFLGANPGWPGEAGLRRAAEKAMRPGENALTVISFFRTEEPNSGNGWARLADAYAATGKPAEALAAAKSAWRSSDLP